MRPLTPVNLNAQPDSSTSLETAKQKPDTPAANHEQAANDDSIVAGSESVVSTVQIEEPITEHLTTTSVSDSRYAFSDCNMRSHVLFLFVGQYADVRETVSVEPRRVR